MNGRTPETGARGAVELTDFDETCATVTHTFKNGKTDKVHRYSMRRCRNGEGRWLVSG
jgi:hypothetical protein